MNLTNQTAFTTGRKRIFCYEDSINADNVQRVVEAALLVHVQNVQEIEWLFQLYKGSDSVIESRTRDGYNADINNKAFVSYYSLIADYAANLFMQNPIVLVNVEGDEEVGVKLRDYNRIHRGNNRYARDKTTAYHVAVCGVGYRFIEMDDVLGVKDSVIDPTSAFSIYGDDTDDQSMAKVYITNVPNDEGVSVAAGGNINELGVLATKQRYHVYTNEKIFSWTEGDETVSVSDAMSWGCPIIEYKTNPFYIGAFERVTSLIQLLSILKSDAVNGVEQNIEGLLFGKNLGLPAITPNMSEEEKKEKKQQWLDAQRSMRQDKQLFINDASKEQKATLEYLRMELNNKDIDVLYESTLKDIITITNTPNSVVNLGASGNSGAADTASGVRQAVTHAKNGEPYWFESAREQSRVELSILNYKGIIKDLDVGAFEFAMQRKGNVDLVTATQAFNTLVERGALISDAAEFTGITEDPNAFEERMLKNIKRMKEEEIEYERRKAEVTTKTKDTENSLESSLPEERTEDRQISTESTISES